MRFISAHRRAPDEAAVACLIRVERHRATDDGASRDWSEVSTVETVANIGVHQEEVTGRDAPAAVPNWQFAPRSIGGTRVTKRHGINSDGAIFPTDNLSGNAHHALQQRRTLAEIAALDEDPSERLGRQCCYQIGDVKRSAVR